MINEASSPGESLEQGCRPESVRSLRDLIDLLEKATAPSRDLDLECWWWGKASQPGVPMESAYKAHNLKMNDAPRYTGSIDAALTLVPDGQVYTLIGSKSASHSFATASNEQTFENPSRGANDAIAICIAALKATPPSQVGTPSSETRLTEAK